MVEENGIVELLDTHASNIRAVGESISTAYEVLAHGEEDEQKLHYEIDELKVKLEDLAARGCNFRRKDFNVLMRKVLMEIEKSKEELFLKREEVKNFISDYVRFQQEFIKSLKEKIIKHSIGEISSSELELFANEMKVVCEKREVDAYRLLTSYQQNLHLYITRLKSLSNKLRRLVNRGESLRAEDLRLLEANMDKKRRATEKLLRQEDVRRMLRTFKRQRKDWSLNKRGE